MSNKKDNSIYPEYIQRFDDIYGLDMVSFYWDEQAVVGYFEKSPIEERVVSTFRYIPNDKVVKPYRAHWMISESKLYIGHVNGVINGKRFFTTELIPEYSDNEIVHHYQEFSGQVKLIIQQKKIPEIFVPFILNKEEMLLTFVRGNLVLLTGNN